VAGCGSMGRTPQLLGAPRRFRWGSGTWREGLAYKCTLMGRLLPPRAISYRFEVAAVDPWSGNQATGNGVMTCPKPSHEESVFDK